MAKYSVTTTLATTPTGNTLVANGASTSNVQVDAAAYAALLQQLRSSATFAGAQPTYTPSGGTADTLATSTDAAGLALVLGLIGLG
jgi:hypothetical protein